jgi:hypothetical protein
MPGTGWERAASHPVKMDGTSESHRTGGPAIVEQGRQGVASKATKPGTAGRWCCCSRAATSQASRRGYQAGQGIVGGVEAEAANRHRLEERVLAGLREKMMVPEAVAGAMRAYAEETNRFNRQRHLRSEVDRAEGNCKRDRGRGLYAYADGSAEGA